MIWKIFVLLSVALCVQGDEDPISEQRVVIHHQKPSRVSLSHVGPNKSGNQDAYAKTYPSYEFSYSVNDPKTHDIKGQHETREGDEVVGNYWLIEPNGRKRTVNYQANDYNGFNAQIDYTAALKQEERVKDIGLSQDKDIEQGSSEKNNKEVIESKVSEETQSDIPDSNETSGDSGSSSAEDETSLTGESDNQEGEANNISNIDRVNVDSNYYDENVSQSTQKDDYLDNTKKENNERNIYKSPRGNHNIKKSKNKNNQDWVSTRNDNERNRKIFDGSKISKRVKQNDNNNRKSNKEKKPNRAVNSNTSQNTYSGEFNVAVNKEQIDENHEERFSKEKNNKKNVQKNARNKETYAFINLSPSEEIQRKIDIPNNEETYEHRIRIYHPKNISPTIINK